jgi:hypothetical protein
MKHKADGKKKKRAENKETETNMKFLLKESQKLAL